MPYKFHAGKCRMCGETTKFLINVYAKDDFGDVELVDGIFNLCVCEDCMSAVRAFFKERRY